MIKSSISDPRSLIPDLRLKAPAILKIKQLMRKRRMEKDLRFQMISDFRSQIPNTMVPGVQSGI